MRALSITSLALLFSFGAMAQLGKDLGDVSQVRGANSSVKDINTGLKEVLTRSTTTAVKAAGVEDGFESNSSIKIQMPDKMQSFEKNLRMAGQGLRIDEFELSMNRAAEMATPGATTIFEKAIAELTFPDARLILNGNSSAASDYLRSVSLAQVTKAFRPIIQAAMNKADVTQQYDYLATQVRGLTLGQPFEFDITTYVMTKTLDGLFAMSSAEESKVRSNPEALESPFLKDVFTKH